MATVANQEDQNNNQQNQQPQTGGSGGASGSTGQGQGGSASVAPVSNVQQNAAPQASQGYTDVGSYLDANQAGSQQLGNQVASNLTNDYNTTKSGIDTSANSLINSVNQGYTQGNDQLINQVAADPTAAAADPNQTAAFQAQLNDTYSGPNSWADYGTQQGNVATAQQNANLVNTPGGLNVLTQQVEQPSTSAGSNQLDTLLLGGNPGAMQNVQNAATPFNDLGAYLDSQNQAANTAIQGGQTAAQTASANALNAFTGANGTLTNLNNTVNNTANTDLTNSQTQYTNLMNILNGVGNNGGVTNALGAITNQSANTGANRAAVANALSQENTTLSPDQLSQLGMTQDQWNGLVNQEQQLATPTFVASPFQGNGSAWTQGQQAPLSQFVGGAAPTADNINASTTATAPQYAEMAAIEQLLGGKTPQGNALNPLNSAMAGTANLNPMTFNYNNANDYLTQLAQSQHQQALGTANNVADAQQSQHIASLNKGLMGSNFGNIAGTISNPTSWLANATAAVQNKPISGTNVVPQINKKGI